MNSKVKRYLFFTMLFSSVFYALILFAGSLDARDGLYVLGLMWTPGLAALATQFSFQKNLRGLGWKAGSIKYWGIAYLAPIFYLFAVYGIVWMTGLGNFPNNSLVETGIPAELAASNGLLIYVLVVGLDLVPAMFSTLGEEIGWRGLLLPELVKTMSVRRATLWTGLFWALWHYPLILFADYNNGLPTLYALACFTIMVMGVSFVYTWLRLKSESLWPAVILHAQGNLLIEKVFNPLTRDTGSTAYITGEFGLALALGAVLLAALFSRLALFSSSETYKLIDKSN